MNGVDGLRKRTAEAAGLEEDEQLRKRGKVAEEASLPKPSDQEEIIVIDDNAPITIDD